MKPITIDIDIDDLALARNQFGSEFLHVLDLRNGRIHMVEEFGGDLTDGPAAGGADNDWEDDDDSPQAVDDDSDDEDDEDDDSDDDAGFDPAPPQEDLPSAHDVHSHPEVFLLIEPRESHIAFRDMEEFVASLPEGEPQRALARSLRLPSPFRAFKDTLYDFPNERDEWFTFSEERQRDDAIAWLREHRVNWNGCASGR